MSRIKKYAADIYGEDVDLEEVAKRQDRSLRRGVKKWLN